MSCKFCHTCENLRAINGGVKCSKGHKLQYKWPEGSTDLTYGFHAPAGCRTSFVLRTPAYYSQEGKPGRRHRAPFINFPTQERRSA
jgi:hypothetical protein